MSKSVVKPEVRARTVQDALLGLDEFRAGATEAVRQRIPPESLALIDNAGVMAWIPFEHDRHVPHSIFAELGDDGEQFFRGLMRRQLEGPVLRSIFSVTRRMFGVSPAALLRASPVAWPAVYRGFGKMRHVRSSSSSACVELEGVPQIVLDWEAYPRSFEGMFGGLIEVCGATGSCAVTVDRSRRAIGIELMWTAARDAGQG